MYTFIKYTSAFGIIIRHGTLTGKVEWLASSFIIRLPANERLTGLLWAGIIIHHTIASSKRLTGLLWAGIIIHHTIASSKRLTGLLWAGIIIHHTIASSKD